MTTKKYDDREARLILARSEFTDTSIEEAEAAGQLLGEVTAFFKDMGWPATRFDEPAIYGGVEVHPFTDNSRAVHVRRLPNAWSVKSALSNDEKTIPLRFNAAVGLWEGHEKEDKAWRVAGSGPRNRPALAVIAAAVLEQLRPSR
jgi:hypothetical protein